MALSDAQKSFVRAARAAQDRSREISRGEGEPVGRLGDGRAHPPTAFVSWAHQGEDWTSQQAANWAQEVVEFAGLLRSRGIDADLDLFHSNDADIDWTRFGPRAIGEADFVLVAISPAWAERWAGVNRPTLGAGAVGEADALKGLFQKDQSAWQRKVVVVVLPSQDAGCIPPDLMRATRFSVDPGDPDSLETLLRTLTGQPLYLKPELGRVPTLPPTVAESLGLATAEGSPTEASEFADYSAVLNAVQKSPDDQKASDRMALLMGLLDALSS